MKQADALPNASEEKDILQSADASLSGAASTPALESSEDFTRSEIALIASAFADLAQEGFESEDPDARAEAVVLSELSRKAAARAAVCQSPPVLERLDAIERMVKGALADRRKPNAVERLMNSILEQVKYLRRESPPVPVDKERETALSLERIYKCPTCGHLRTPAGLLRGTCDRAECPPVIESPPVPVEDNDLGAGLIGQVARPLAETEPRPTSLALHALRELKLDIDCDMGEAIRAKSEPEWAMARLKAYEDVMGLIDVRIEELEKVGSVSVVVGEASGPTVQERSEKITFSHRPRRPRRRREEPTR